ncbi:hypothetical protein COSO111634_37880 [Corallococcus soli]
MDTGTVTMVSGSLYVPTARYTFVRVGSPPAWISANALASVCTGSNWEPLLVSRPFTGSTK